MPDASDILAATHAQIQAGRLADAEDCCRAVLAAAPDHVDALVLLGVIVHQRGRSAEAVELMERALRLDPGVADAHNNLGNLLLELGRAADAIASFERALALKPRSPELHYNLGNGLKAQGRLDEAILRYEQALALKPDHANAHRNLGNVLFDLGRLGDAAARYERGLEVKPDSAELHCNLGLLRQYQGRMDEAEIHLGRALALEPDHARARLALCMAQLRVLYRDEAEIARQRAAYERELRGLAEAARAPRFARELGKVAGAAQPFFLAYQGLDDRALQSRYGALMCAIAAADAPPAAPAPPPGPGEKMRVGIVSGYFWRHSNWKMPIKGWLGQLDRDRFELFGYYTGTRQDDETEIAAGLCRRFVRGPLPLERWRAAILADRPHVLIYPEIGMNPMSARLATQRLARVQCNSWGHPDTSGYPTLDYYLSSALMEPPDGDAHYTERLVRLPNLSIYYEPIEVEPMAIDRAALGLRPAATVYWCCQPLFKYLPQHDEVFPRIARAAGDCQFAFIRSPKGAYVNEQFRQRLERVFAAFGMRATDHCLFVPYLAPDRFMAAMGQCDVYLDSIGWSGCNSSLESLAHDLPIVTIKGPLMRGRHSAAILEMMGVADTIADGIDSYVATAARLARDRPWRDDLRRRIGERKHRIYRDRSCIAALEDFLEKAVSGGIPEPRSSRRATSRSVSS